MDEANPAGGMDWRRARKLFPAVEQTVYLNTAGGGPLSAPAAEAGRSYYEQSLRDGDVHWDGWLERVEVARARLARFLGTTEANVAFAANASTGLNVAAHMLRGRGRVVAVADEFPSCTLPFLQLGHEVEFVPTATDGVVDLDALQAACGDDAGALVVSFVQYKSGFRNDLARLGEFCRANDLAFVVDATQGFGAFPLDTGAGAIDFLSFSGYKWANAGYSIAGVCLSDRFLRPDEFPAVGWRSPRQPYRLAYDRLDIPARAAALELGHPPFAGVFALAASLELIEKIGIDRIAERIIELTGWLHQRLDAAGIPVLSTRKPAHLSGITIAGVADPAGTVGRLRERGILVSTRGEGIRVSVHYYNNHADIEELVNALVNP